MAVALLPTAAPVAVLARLAGPAMHVPRKPGTPGAGQCERTPAERVRPPTMIMNSPGPC